MVRDILGPERHGVDDQPWCLPGVQQEMTEVGLARVGEPWLPRHGGVDLAGDEGGARVA